MTKRLLHPLIPGMALLLTACAEVRPPPTSDTTFMAAVMRTVERNYVEPVGADKLRDGALRGMLQSLDPHSDYMSERDFRSFMSEAKGAFGGIGIEIGEQEGQLAVIAPIDGTPASRAGLLPGDRIVAIAGEPTAGLSLTEAVSKLRGPQGTPVTIGIRRASEPEPFDVTLTREIVRLDPVAWRLEQGVGYIRLSVFNEHAGERLKLAIRDIRAKAGGGLKGYVLDLRNDPGGLLDQAIEVADVFLAKGDIVAVRGRTAEDERRYRAAPGDLTEGAPMIVLINGGSASASEIVAGALQDNRRARVIGTQSFGKGSVQTIIPLDGNGALRLTTARYYTPSGRSIQAVGIAPDEVVRGPEDREPNLQEADLRGALKNDTGGKAAERRVNAAAVGKARPISRFGKLDATDGPPDEPLRRAVELLARPGAGVQVQATTGVPAVR